MKFLALTTFSALLLVGCNAVPLPSSTPVPATTSCYAPLNGTMAEKHQCEQNYLGQLSADLTNEVDACAAVEKAIAARDNCSVAALPLNEDVLRIMFFSYCTKKTQHPTEEEQCLIKVSLEAALELQTIKQLSVPILSEACCVLTKTIQGAHACPNGVTKEQLLKMFDESYATRCAGSISQSPDSLSTPSAATDSPSSTPSESTELPEKPVALKLQQQASFF